MRGVLLSRSSVKLQLRADSAGEERELVGGFQPDRAGGRDAGREGERASGGVGLYLLEKKVQQLKNNVSNDDAESPQVCALCLRFRWRCCTLSNASLMFLCVRRQAFMAVLRACSKFVKKSPELVR